MKGVMYRNAVDVRCFTLRINDGLIYKTIWVSAIYAPEYKPLDGQPSEDGNSKLHARL